jgi:tyrosyl-tRNA synthetase
LGGDDQWSNILAGVELIRRKEQGDAYGMTFRLLTTSAGTKMGKSAGGAVWLDPAKTPPFDFYQYWRNIDDADVENRLKMLTFVPLEEIAALTSHREAINEAKKRLAYEVTAIVHGQAKADTASRQAADLFEGGGRSDTLPATSFPAARLVQGLSILDVLLETGLAPSKGEGRRLVTQGGVYLNGEAVTDIGFQLGAEAFASGEAVLRKGKKIYHKLILEN